MRINLFGLGDKFGENEVHIGHFIGKIILCMILLWILITMIQLKIDDASYDSSHSSSEYYVSRLDDNIAGKEYAQMYDTLLLYDLYGEEYDKYWEIANAYNDYLYAKAYVNASAINSNAVKDLDTELSEAEEALRQDLNNASTSKINKIISAWYDELF